MNIYIKEFINLGSLYPHKFRAIISVLGYMFAVILSSLLIPFYKFHITLVLNNSTTIESLEKEQANENLKV